MKLLTAILRAEARSAIAPTGPPQGNSNQPPVVFAAKFAVNAVLPVTVKV